MDELIEYHVEKKPDISVKYFSLWWLSWIRIITTVEERSEET